MFYISEKEYVYSEGGCLRGVLIVDGLVTFDEDGTCFMEEYLIFQPKWSAFGRTIYEDDPMNVEAMCQWMSKHQPTKEFQDWLRDLWQAEQERREERRAERW